MDNIDNNVATLEYLLKVKSEKKKEPSKIERDQFHTAWVKVSVDEGYSERAERFLYNGVSYCGAKPFKGFIDQAENKEQALQSFFTGKMYGTNAETTFRLLVHLFALLLNDKKSANMASIILMRFPHACINKEKKRLGNIEAILLKYFFAELDPKVSLVPLTELGVKKTVFIDDFISEMEVALKNIDPSGLSKNKIANIAKVRQWIEAYRQSKTEGKALSVVSSDKENPPTLNGAYAEDVASEEPATEVLIVSTGNSTTKRRPVQTEEVEKSMPAETDNERQTDMMVYLMTLLGKASKAAMAVKSESTQQKIKIDALANALEGEQNKLACANQRIVELQSTIVELQKNLSDAKSEIFVLRQTVEQKDVIIAAKDAEISERIKMADVLSRDRSKQADETLQRLVSKIKVEYRDFADALDVPMSCDLGENLRLQLQSIFDILEKGGMKFK